MHRIDTSILRTRPIPFSVPQSLTSHALTRVSLLLHVTISTIIASEVSNIMFAHISMHAYTGGGAQTAAIKVTADH